MISQDIAKAVIAKALETGGDFAEIFVENTNVGTINMIDKKIDSAVNGKIYGAGIRIFKGLKSVYACTNDVTLSGLMAAAENAASAIGNLNVNVSVDLTASKAKNISPIIYLPTEIEAKRKIEMVKRAYNACSSQSSEIVQTIALLTDRVQDILIANSDGLFITDRRVRTRLGVQAIASNGTENQAAFEGPGRSMGFEMFDSEVDPEYFGNLAAKTAISVLHAPYCPARKMTVAIENGFGGVIFHEACGHSLEAEAVAKGLSVFADKKGQQIASKKVTAIDDGTLPNYWGSINIDDEGTPSQKNVLITDGILTGYMVDKLNGRRMGEKSTGSGRRESYKYAPVSRMTNTYIANGNDKNEDIIKSISDGLYAKKMGGGSVNPVTGEFNFAISEGYIVKNGVIDHAVRGASLIGKGSDILMNIDMVGKNLDMGQGMCGAASGSVPTNVGQPLIRVSEITVGGR